MKKYAVVLAGGSGLRAGGEVPKQFQKVGGLPLLWWAVRAFHEEDPHTEIHLVMHPGFFDLWDILASELPEADSEIRVELVCGGRDRLESVRNGIERIPAEEDALVAVHDAARPAVTPELIRRGWEEARQTKCAIPVVKMTDSIRLLEPPYSKALDRSRYVRVQTPQVFRADVLKESYSRELTPDMTDDASVVEKAGYDISLFEGDERNIKVTNPIDFLLAEIILSAER